VRRRFKKLPARTFQQLQHPPAGLSWRDYLITLLRIAGEIEHALMTQYLYAAYSLGGDDAQKEAETVRGWRDTLLTVAREEMGHLVTVQNLLLLLGGPVSFERHEHPWSSPFYPFEFNLERFSRRSLAQYIYAEMPTNMTDAGDIEVRDKVRHILGHTHPVEVAVIYDHIIDLLADRKKIPDTAFDPDCYHYQVTWDEFGRGYRPNNQSPRASQTNAKAPADGRARVIIAQVVTRTDALAALRDVAGQGEAEQYKLDDGNEKSHFRRFVDMFKEFEAIRRSRGDSWSPSLPVPRNPSADELEASSESTPPTLSHPAPNEAQDSQLSVATTAAEPAASDGAKGAESGPASPGAPARKRRPGKSTPIEDHASRTWAQLFNYRYRMLLLLLTYVYHVQRDPPARLTSLRAQVLARIFGEMYHMKTIAGILVRMPLNKHPEDPAGAKLSEVAGPPFQLPFSLALPQGEENFWRMQTGLLDASRVLIEALQKDPGKTPKEEGGRFLTALTEIDRDAHDWMDKILSGGLFGWRISG